MSYVPDPQGRPANPYQTPAHAPQSPRAPRPPRSPGASSADKLPTLCLVMFILDLAFSGIRFLIVLVTLAMLGAAAQAGPNPLDATIRYEILFSVAVVLASLAANIVCLLRKPAGLALGIISLIATAALVIVNLWQLSIFLRVAGPQQAQTASMAIGAGLSLLVRLVFNGLYVAALVKFAGWLKIQERSRRFSAGSGYPQQRGW